MRNEAATFPATTGAAIAADALRPSLPADDTTNRKNMGLLIQLRWTAVAGQIGTIAFVTWWFGITLPLLPICLLYTSDAADE